MTKQRLIFFHKNIILVIIVFLFVQVKNSVAQGTCATATNIASVPYNKTGLTNCGNGANYSGIPACLTATDFDGEDFVFKYTPTTTGCVNAMVTFDANSTPWNSGFAILNKCPNTAGASCVSSTAGGLGASSLVLGSVNLTAGTTYYFVISGGQSLFGSSTGECFGFDFKLTTCPIPPPPLPTDPQGIECGSNLGFENGDLSGWTGFTGTSTQTPTTTGLFPGVTSVNGSLGTCVSMPAAGIGARQTRTTGGGFDPNTDNVVSVVAPGCRTSSVRIGNQEAGYESEAMEKTFLVTSSNVLFTYLYAVVLQNPAGHTTTEQPKFQITIKNNGGNLISCGGTYAVTADNALSEGFTRASNSPCGSPDVWYKPWTAVGTDLTPYIGQNVTIRFTTIDCTQGGHFGYAYVDTYCKPKEIFGTKVCTLGSSISLTAPQGFLDYTWSPGGGTGQTITVNNPVDGAIYTVTFKSIVGASCISTVTDTIKVIKGTITGDTTICSGATGTKKLIATSTDAASIYSWTSTPAGFTSSSATPSVPLPAVTTVYKVTITSPLGCSFTKSVTITVNPCNFNVNTTSAKVCAGVCPTITVTPNGGTAPFTYLWNTGATTTAITACPAATTSYTVNVTDNTGKTASSTTSITIDPPILLNIAGFPPKCSGGNDGQAVVIPSGGDGLYSYQWAPVTGTAASVNGPAGTYSVTVTDLFGCTAKTSTTIVDPPPIVGTTSVIASNCNQSDGSATVATVSGGTPGYTYSWNTAPVQNTQTASNIPTGNYIVTITDANGCTTTLVAFVPNTGGITVSTTKLDVTCFGGNNGSATATQTSGTAPYTYSWNNGQNTANATTLIAGTYTVIVTDANGCSASAIAIIAQPTQVVVTSTSSSMCQLTSASISASGTGGTGAITYAWNPGALTGSSITVSPANTTMYTLVGTDANGCAGTTTATVTVNPNPVITVPGATICYGASTPLTASGANTYTWAPTTGLIPTTGANVIANPTVTTTYTVLGTDANGCTGATTVVVAVSPVPVISVPPSSICPGDTTTLTASGAITYSWSPTAGLSPTTGSTVLANPTITTTYIITGTNSFGCTGLTTTVVTVHPEPKASFTANPNPASVLNPTIFFTDLTGGAVTWNWSLGDVKNSSSTIKNPSFTYPDSIGKYNIRLIVTNQFGCIDTTYGTVVVKGEYTFFIPNTFTPNGDGTNDYFFPKGVGVDPNDYDLWVFDRWGNMIWHTSTWGEAWDGRANGGENIAQIDTYVWKVHVRELDNHAVHNYIGHVNIVK